MKMLFAALAAAALAPSIAHSADGSETYALRNGARVQAQSVKESGEKIYLDLGFDILGIPRAEIVETKSAETKPAASRPAVAAQLAANSESAAAGSWQAVAKAASSQRKKRTASEMLNWAKKSVVIVSTPKGFGAGFVIDRQGRIVTNQHVVLDEKYVDVTLIQGRDGQLKHEKIKSVEILAISPLMDIALLQIPEKDRARFDVEPLPLAEDGSLGEGDAVFAIGNPGMGGEILDHTLSEGIVSSVDRNFNDVLYIQTTAAVNPGNSGGPLLNAYGEIVGLVSLKAIFQEGIAFALPLDYIHFFLRNQKAYAYGKANPNKGYQYLTPD